MPLPASWVDHLFVKLTVRYGEAFQRQYADLDPAAVKADWADVLDRFDGDALRYALQYLPATPPNAMQFRDICRRSPRADVPALEGPVDREAAARAVAMIADALATKPADLSPAQQCIENIRKAADRASLTGSQRWVLACCEMQAKGDPVHGGESQHAVMIPADVLPPAMREAA